MSSNCSIKLHDRVKQISNTEGTGNMALHSSVDGFLNFGNVYSHQDTVFYGISDGINFEIGSGIFLRADFDGSDAITVDQINRKAFTSSATDSGIVNFPSGAKEVFVTYAATHAVFHGSGINSFSPPDNSGIVFWGCDNILDYDSNFVWDKDNKYLGIRKSSPTHGIELGGDGTAQSMVKASGFVVGSTGIHFPSGNGLDASYSGGVQYKHFIPNSLAEVNVSSVLELSGAVKEIIWFKKQSSGQVFAGPSSGLADGYPNFRSLNINDAPFVTTLSGVLGTRILATGNAVMSDIINVSGNLNTSNSNIITSLETASGLLNSGISITSGVITANVLRNPLTNDLHLGGHALSGIGSLNIVGSGSFGNNLHVSGNIVADGSITSSGSLSVNGMTHNGLVRWEYPTKPLDNNITDFGYLRFYDETNGIAGIGVSTSSFNVGTSGTLNLRFIGQQVELARFDTAGNFIFNDGLRNCDFRVAGDTDSNLIFSDASTDKVGIGTNSPASKLHVFGSTTEEGSIISSTANSGSWAGLIIRDDKNINVGSFQFGNSGVGQGITTEFPYLARTIFLASRESGVALNLYQGRDRESGGSASVPFKPNNERILLDTDGNTTITAASGQNVTLSGEMILRPQPSPSGQTVRIGRHPSQATIKSIGSTITTNAGDLANRWMVIESSGQPLALNYFNNDDVRIAYGGGNVGIGTVSPGSNKLYVAGGPAVFDGGNFVVNQSGGNHDFRVEGDTDEYLIFADASLDSVGVGDSALSSQIKFNVRDNMELSTIGSSGVQRAVYLDLDHTLVANDNTGGPARLGGVDGSTTRYSIGISSDTGQNLSSGVRNSGYLMGMEANAKVTGSGYLHNAYGLRTFAGGHVPFPSSGHIQNSIGVYPRVLNLGSGTMHNAMGVYSVISAGSNGKIGNAYGVYLYPNGGTITSGNYGIYQQGTEDNYFGGTLDTASSGIRIRDDHTPASASADGFKGQIVWDANYIYICTATNTWKRAGLSTW